jgi:hypothetical protein
MVAYPTRGVHFRLLLPIVVVAALVAGVLVWAPTAAFACSGGPSAENVYKECIPTAGGSQPTSGAKSSGHAGSAQPAVSPQAAKALEHAGKDRRQLAHLLRGYGTNGLSAPTSSNTAATEPSALGAAFDLGSGPTALLIMLAGTTVLLLAGSGFGVWRHRHHT